EAAGENADNLSSVWLRQHLNTGNPLNPFKAAAAWGNQPQGKAMLIRKRLLADMCRQQRSACFHQRQAPAITCYRDETHIARLRGEAGIVEEASDTNTSPVLGAVEATGTIQITPCHKL